jgi:hypothetical protein
MKENNVMERKKNLLAIPDELVISKIYLIRGQKVMLDSDLAELYQVETKRLKEQVKRNLIRFPKKHMFVLTGKEYESLRSQFATSKISRGGSRYLPMVFTEHGVLQLSNVLTSERAIKVSFLIIDVFVKLRNMLSTNTKILLQLELLKKKINVHDKNIELVFHCLDKLLEERNAPQKPKKQIGFKQIKNT